MSKTLLLLGGSASQVVAIRKAHDLGYRTVLCDYLPDNPGQEFADVFYQVSTTDLDAVLKVATEERVNGIVAYGSDPAAPTAAYVSEQLGLPGIPYETARSFCEKPLFRLFLESNGFNVPEHLSINSESMDDFSEALSHIKLPVIIKPSDSSGSKGVTVVRQIDEIDPAIAKAFEFSRNGTVEVEEYLVSKHEGVIEAEIFVYEGEVVSWGLMRCLRDAEINPLLPAGYRHPLDLPHNDLELVKSSIEALIRAGGIPFGALNIEIIISPENKLFFIDAGPRNGGNMLPYFFSLISGDDLVEGTLRCAMGEPWSHSQFDGANNSAWYMHVLHSNDAGFFDRIEYSPVVVDAIRYENVFLSQGDEVRPFKTSTDIIGLVIMQFDSADKLEEVLANLRDNIKVVIGKECLHG